MNTLNVPIDGNGSDGNHLDYLHSPKKYKGILNWILSTDHKKIGILYLISMLTFFSVGVFLWLFDEIRTDFARENDNGAANL